MVPKEVKQKLFFVLRLMIAFAPWLVGMYTLYWLGKSGTWDADTPHRDLMSGAIVAGGMLATFLTYTVLTKHKKN